LWNATATAAGTAHVRLGDELQVTDAGRGAHRGWRHVTVTSGITVGLVGWTLNANLQAARPAP
jgi:hypothetical protein